WDMLGSAQHVGKDADRTHKVEVNALTPSFKNIKIRNIIIERSSDFVKINGIPESPLQHVLIENVDAQTDKLFFSADAQDITLRNISLKSKDSTLYFVDSRRIFFENVKFHIPTNEIIKNTSGGDSSTIK